MTHWFYWITNILGKYAACEETMGAAKCKHEREWRFQLNVVWLMWIKKSLICSLSTFLFWYKGLLCPETWEKPVRLFKSITASSLIHPSLPFENQVPCVQNETVELQTNLMNNPAELLFKLDYSDCEMYGGKLEFSLRRVLSKTLMYSASTGHSCGSEHRGQVCKC